MSLLESSDRDVEILECTLRDGSYAVDFKFTEMDTSLLTKLLAKLGFQWIEVGHGWGLGAGQSGKGSMPASDEAIIRAAKQSAGTARIGAFCIQGIASLDSVKLAREAGLDFIRIGANATEVEKAFPYIELARKVGLIPFINFMKTHAISPADFARKGKQAFECGAQVIYGVDSSGGMLLKDVTAYFSALGEHCGCPMGFHAHNNLQMAVANAMEAYRCGVRFIDTTLSGIGRSAGNVPTEVAIALFEKMEIQTGIDLFDVMEVVDRYLSPLSSRIQLHDTLAVAMGFGQFHSSFLPKVKVAAQRHRVDLRRLVVAVGKESSGEVGDGVLDQIASSLPKVGEPSECQDALVSFPFPEMSEARIYASIAHVQSLMEGMLITASKRRSRSILELVASETPVEDLVLAEVILEDDDVVLGRVRFGSFEVLKEVLRLAEKESFALLFDLDGGRWADPLPRGCLDGLPAERIGFVHSKKLLESYVSEVLTLSAYHHGRSAAFLYGNPSPALLSHANDLFQAVFLYPGISDLAYSNVKMNVILCLCPPSVSEGARMGRLLSNAGALLSLGHYPRLEALEELKDKKIVRLNPRHAYRGQVKRWMEEGILFASPKEVGVRES